MVTITPLPRVMENRYINCPGDIIPYNCLIQSNSERLHLIWRVNLPGQKPVDIIYNNNSNFSNTTSQSSIYITSSLVDFARDNYIESIIAITVQLNFTQLILNCSIGDFGSTSTEVFINSSSKYLFY